MIRCVEGNRFSAAVSHATQGTRFNGVATFAAQSAEIFPALSVAGDVAAMSARAARPGMPDTTKTDASGVNWLIRRTVSGSLKKRLQLVGGRVITPVMAWALTESQSLIGWHEKSV